jgi:hypothetical protein
MSATATRSWWAAAIPIPNTSRPVVKTTMLFNVIDQATISAPASATTRPNWIPGLRP